MSPVRDQPDASPIAKLLREAIHRHQSGHLPEAERLYRQILLLCPGHSDVNHNLGILALQVQKPKLALPYFEAAIKANSGYEQYWRSYIEGLIQCDQLCKARRVLEGRKQGGHTSSLLNKLEDRLRALEAENESATSSVSVEKILKLFNDGRYTEVATLARLQTQSDPQNGLSWKLLGTALKILGKNGEASFALQKAANLLPDDGEVHCNLGLTFADLSQLAAAEASLRHALAIKGDFAEAHYNLGIVTSQQGRLDDAVECFRRAAEIKPDYVEALCNLGAAQNELQQHEDAERSCRRALALKPDYVEAYNNLGIALQGQGKNMEAEAILRAGMQLSPRNAHIYNNLATTLAELGRYDEAEQSYRCAMKYSPLYANAYLNLATTLKALGRYDEAEGALVSALRIKPDYAEAYYNLGNTLKDLGRLAEAESAFLHAQELNPNSSDSYINLGVFLTDTGRLNEAEACFLRGLQQARSGKENVAAMALTTAWIAGDDRYAKMLINEYATKISVARTKRLSVQLVFFEYVARLVEHKERYPALYETNGDVESLVVLGDSHCMAPHKTEFNWLDNQRVRASARFVYGIKMHHLAQSHKKNYSITLSEQLRSIAPRAHLLFTIGEIDCRPDEGIWHVVQKRKLQTVEVIDSTLKGYLQWIDQETSGRQFASVTLQGVPAPNYLHLTKYDHVDRQGFIDMICTLNDHLEKGAIARGWKFLDVYSPTRDQTGVSHGKWHLDTHHLQPLFYAQAEKWLKD